MSRNFSNHTPTASSSSNNSHTHLNQHPKNPRSKFREHLSIQIPHPEPGMRQVDLEISRFSPESPPPPFRSPSPISRIRNHSPMARTSRGRTERGYSKEKERERDVEAAVLPASPNPRGSLKDRFTRFFFDARTFSPKEKDHDLFIPIQHHTHSHSRSDSRTLSEWPPLHVSKRCTCQHDPANEAKRQKRKRRNLCLFITLVIVLLYLLGSSTFSLVQVMSLQPSPTPSKSDTNTTANLNAQQCISQYTLNAPSSPSTYPCSTCLPLLSSLPRSFTSALSGQDSQSAQNAAQFCALKSVLDNADSEGQASLGGGGWVKDVKFCAWTGVGCDGAGRVSTLQLTTPGVPASVPTELGTLTGLQSISIIGNNRVPAGTVPPSFNNLTALTTLHLESTGLSALPDTLFAKGAIDGLQTVQLIKNTGMGGVPGNLIGLGLKNIVINGQTLDTSTLQSIASSSSLQSSLQLLDLSQTSLSATLPSLPSFSALTELHLDNANIQSPLPGPGSYPPNLHTLSMSGNNALGSGGVGGICAISGLGSGGGSCDLGGTGLSAPQGGCGVCSF